MWSDLKQDEKFELIKDYVRRGFHNLDDIVNDYDSSLDNTDTQYSSYEKSYHDDPMEQVIRELYDEYYG